MKIYIEATGNNGNTTIGEAKIAGLTITERVVNSFLHLGLDKITLFSENPEQLQERYSFKNNYRPLFKTFSERGEKNEEPVIYLKSFMLFSLPFLEAFLTYLKTDESKIVCDETKGIFFIPSNYDLSKVIINELKEDFVIFSANGQIEKINCQECAKAFEKILLKSVIKPSDGFVSKNFNRKISTFISKRLLNTGITPNQFTLFTILIFLIMPFFLLRGDYIGFLLGFFLFNLNSVIDGCDGEIARLKFLQTKLGAWMDTTVDMSGIVLMVFCLPFGLYNKSSLKIYPVLGLLILTSLLLLLIFLYYQSRKNSNSGQLYYFGNKIASGLKERPFLSRLFNLGMLLGKRDLYATVFLLFALFGWHEIIFYSVFLGIFSYIIIICISLYKFRKMV